MSLVENLRQTALSITEKSLNRYRLIIASCTAKIDVEDFSGFEAMSELYRYVIRYGIKQCQRRARE